MDDHCGALPPDGHGDEQGDTEQQGAEPRTGTGAEGLDHQDDEHHVQRQSTQHQQHRRRQVVDDLVRRQEVVAVGSVGIRTARPRQRHVVKQHGTFP